MVKIRGEGELWPLPGGKSGLILTRKTELECNSTLALEHVYIDILCTNELFCRLYMYLFLHFNLNLFIFAFKTQSKLRKLHPALNGIRYGKKEQGYL